MEDGDSPEHLQVSDFKAVLAGLKAEVGIEKGIVELEGESININ